ncbi:hypothetical protein CROQUDRAFT_109570 [Cronartium quercuum f. sp. fusiforme G11]|uniref:Uncharacterized protein n=1 Tax=Cronartium quercuum f. sp. fusiforme G11 TaxID=708437 RepID=A0A9P6T8S4_9BASI|nr:hypothetical protein CROQUDRAFT_109570 [Cronartium quercuum f. sp. fusiforme G11]
MSLETRLYLPQTRSCPTGILTIHHRSIINRPYRGISTVRVLVINKQFPGPLIEANDSNYSISTIASAGL